MKQIAETIGDHLLLYIKANFRTQVAAAKAIGVRASFINQVVHGERMPNQAILDAMGMERRVRYVDKGVPETGGYPE